MNAVVDFDFRGIGTYMPRRRSQVGWVRRVGKNWVGFAYRYEPIEGGGEKRRVKQHTIGSCSETTKADAMRQHQDWVATLDAPQLDSSVPVEPATFEETWQKYSTLKEESAAWGRHYASTLRAAMQHWVLPILGSRNVASLRVDDLMRPLLAMSAAGKNTHYIHNAKQAIQGTMDYAEENRWIEHNPAHSKFFRKPRSSTPEVRAIEQQELVDRVIDELRKEENLKLLVAVAVSGIGGARRQELWVLRWNDIRENSIRLDEAWKRYERPERRIGATKTGRDREVPIGPGVHRVLMQWKESVNPTNDSEFIFPSESIHGWPENLDNLLRRDLRPFGERVGVPGLTFRMLRKTAASLFGNDVKSAQAHLGHARPDTTAIHYMAEPAAEHMKKVLEIDRALLGRPQKQRSSERRKATPASANRRTSART